MSNSSRPARHGAVWESTEIYANRSFRHSCYHAVAAHGLDPGGPMRAGAGTRPPFTPARSSEPFPMPIDDEKSGRPKRTTPAEGAIVS